MAKYGNDGIDSKKLAKLFADDLFVYHDGGMVYLSDGRTIWHVSRETARDTLSKYPELFTTDGVMRMKKLTVGEAPNMAERWSEFAASCTEKTERTDLIWADSRFDTKSCIFVSAGKFIYIDSILLEPLEPYRFNDEITSGGSPTAPIKIGETAIILPMRVDEQSKYLTMPAA